MIAKLRLPIDDERAPLIPVLIPDLAEVRALADQLHARGEAWQGKAFGWSAEYNPQQPHPPLDSALTFTPADFCIGESGIWFFSRQWEDGHAAGADSRPPNPRMKNILQRQIDAERTPVRRPAGV